MSLEVFQCETSVQQAVSVDSNLRANLKNDSVEDTGNSTCGINAVEIILLDYTEFIKNG